MEMKSSADENVDADGSEAIAEEEAEEEEEDDEVEVNVEDAIFSQTFYFIFFDQ